MQLTAFVDCNGVLISLHEEELGNGSDVIALHINGTKVNANNLSNYHLDVTAVDMLVITALVRMDDYFSIYNEDLVSEYMTHFNSKVSANLSNIYKACSQARTLDMMRRQIRYLFELGEWEDSDELEKIMEFAFHIDTDVSDFLEGISHEAGTTFDCNSHNVELMTLDELSADKEDFMDDILHDVPDHLRRFFDEDKYWDEHGDNYNREHDTELNFMGGETIYLQNNC